MGFWGRLASAFRPAASSRAPGGSTLISSWGGVVPLLQRGTPEAFKAYALSPFFRMVSQRLASERAAAQRKCTVLFDGPDDDQSRQQLGRDDPRYDVIRALRCPVRLASGQVITPHMRRRLTALYYGLAGEAYEGKLRDRVTGRVVALVPFSPLWVMSTPTNREPWYLIQTGAESPPKKIPASEVIPYVDMDPTDPLGRGIGASLSQAQEIDTDDGAAEMMRAVLENQGTPQGALLIEGASPEAVSVARANWRERFGGPSRSGQVEIMGGKAQWIPFTQREVFTQSIEVRKFLRDSFCHVNGISPELFGITEGGTRDSAWVANTNFALGALVPWLELATDQQQAHLVPDFAPSSEDACLGYTSPVPDDRDLQVRLMATAPSAFRGRDARRAGGFAPDPELDERVLGSEPQRSTPTQLPKTPSSRALPMAQALVAPATGPEQW